MYPNCKWQLGDYYGIIIQIVYNKKIPLHEQKLITNDQPQQPNIVI
jgi:hypothetical protein